MCSSCLPRRRRPTAEVPAEASTKEDEHWLDKVLFESKFIDSLILTITLVTSMAVSVGLSFSYDALQAADARYMAHYYPNQTSTRGGFAGLLTRRVEGPNPGLICHSDLLRVCYECVNDNVGAVRCRPGWSWLLASLQD